ncbi:hypothetical protein [Streptomyces sp. NPDC058595]|uniref:DUF6197 family protein n=1 Tax=Streptomyces sp. NPDC058595 TaxID=3346550 RepID=UPI0036642786
MPPPTTSTPTTKDPAQTTQAPTTVELSLEERLTLATTAITMRLDEAAAAYLVNTAHIATDPVDLANVLTVPLTPTLQPQGPAYRTPVAALLQRAHHRVVAGGWCTGALLDPDGARCLYGAIRAEARGDHRLEADAAAVLLEAIRRQFGDDVDSVPAFNDAWGNGRVPVRMLDQAAGLADVRGI